jgi:hypothetical protein
MYNNTHEFNPTPDLPPAFEDGPQVTYLTPRDVPALLDLEREKWDNEQAASAADLEARIGIYPKLSIGAFCPRTDRALASLFLRPVSADFWQHTGTWTECTELPPPRGCSVLFGISLSSREPSAVDAILRFFWPHALKHGWRHIYLGSPVPGLRDWLCRQGGGRVEDYVHRKRSGLPVDPQLRYYHLRGFKDIVCIKPGYFPHARSLDHGVILRGTIPLSTLAPVWRNLPLRSTQRVTRRLASLL